MGRFRLVAQLGLVAVALVAGACSSSDSEVSSGSTNPPGTGTTVPVGGSMMTTTPASEVVTADMLVDQTFVSTSVTGYELATGTSVTLSFTATDLSATAGCNTLGGAYSLQGGKLVVDGDLRSTMMACPEPVMAQDTWISEFLQSDPAIVATGDGIALTSGDVTIELAAETGGTAGTPTLIGPTWTLVGIESGDAVSSVPAGVEPPTLVFAADGSVAVFTGCNSGSTTAAVGDDGFITFEPMMTTMMSCGPDADGVAATVTGMLDGRVAYGWSGTADLRLSKAGEALVFQSS